MSGLGTLELHHPQGRSGLDRGIHSRRTTANDLTVPPQNPDMTRKKSASRIRSPQVVSSGDVPRLRIKNPEDFIAIVPYLLGFHPIESIVAIFFDRGRVRLTARVDLPELSAVGDLVAELASLGRQLQAASVVFLAYSSRPDSRAVLDRVVVETGLEPVEALLVTPERWWSALCSPGRAGECCPADGTPYDISGHPLCAEAVLAGLSAVSDRNLVDDMVAGPAPEDLAGLDELAAEAVLDLVGVDRVRRKRRIQNLVTASLADPTGLSDRTCAEFAALCLDLGVRDVAWALMRRDEADAHLTLWRRVLSRTVDDLASAPLGLVAMAAWISGNGALLNCCIARLELLDPSYGLLAIAKDISWRAVDPSLWDTMSASMRTDPELLAG